MRKLKRLSSHIRSKSPNFRKAASSEPAKQDNAESRCPLCDRMLLWIVSRADEEKESFELRLPDRAANSGRDGCHVCRSIQDFLKAEHKPDRVSDRLTTPAVTDQVVLITKDFPDPDTRLYNVLGISLHTDAQDTARLLIRTTANVGTSRLTYRVKEPFANIRATREWLANCDNNHKECRARVKETRNRKLPSRLLEIMNESVRLIKVAGEMEHAPLYAALSYCWGTARTLTSTTENVELHAKGIVITSLPKTIADAVRVCQAVDVHYMWVDALCILQDSQEDWELECPKMSDVFANSYLTIGALDAEGAGDGFLHPYAPEVEPVLQFTVNDAPFPPVGVRLEKIPTPEPIDVLPLLFSRGWTFQERLLSHRVLYFAKDQMSWHCAEHQLSDALWGDLKEEPLERQRLYVWGMTRVLVPDELALHMDPLVIYYYWQSIVKVFSNCRLTKKSDKLPALSGLAAHCHKMIPDDEYLAGTWLAFPQMWFGWRTTKTSIKYAMKPEALDEPSWSWMSDDSAMVAFEKEATKEEPMFHMAGHDTVRAGADPYGRLKHSHLFLEAFITAPGKVRIRGDIPGSRPTLRLLFVHTLQIGRTDTGTTIGEVTLDFKLCNYDVADWSEREIALMLLTADPGDETTWTALVLVPSSKEVETPAGSHSQAPVFSRIGLATSMLAGRDIFGWETKQLVLV